MKALLLILTMLFSQFSFSQRQDAYKHPRVLELEEKYSSEASLYFSRRFPGKAFVVKVEIIPNKTKFSSSERRESLPYFEYDTEEKLDEWDDLSIPLTFLRNRVNKITVEVLVPNDFKKKNITSLNQDLFNYLKLVPYRDDIRVEKMLPADGPSTIPQHYYIISALIVCSLILGFMIKLSASTLNKGMGANQAAPQAPVITPSRPEPQINRESSGSSQRISLNEITVTDSIRMLDLAHNRIKIISESDTFPTLNDMIMLDSLGSRNPARLGGLICEFPGEWQAILLKFAKDEKWLEAFSQPGKLDNESMSVLEVMCRSRTFRSGSKEVESLLIHVWRLNNSSETFMRKIPREHAFLIMDYFPKSVSLPMARNLFPGTWALMLDKRGNKKVTIDEGQIREYVSICHSLKPLYGTGMVDEYRKDKEILDYLDTVNIEEERDIYEALSVDSFVKTVRKPFYLVLGLPQDKLATLINKFPLDIWALSIFNSSRVFTKLVMDPLDDKKKMLFSTYLKKYDDQKISSEQQVHWRKQILTSAMTLFPEEFAKFNVGADLTFQEFKESA